MLVMEITSVCYTFSSFDLFPFLSPDALEDEESYGDDEDDDDEDDKNYLFIKVI